MQIDLLTVLQTEIPAHGQQPQALFVSDQGCKVDLTQGIRDVLSCRRTDTPANLSGEVRFDLWIVHDRDAKGFASRLQFDFNISRGRR